MCFSITLYLPNIVNRIYFFISVLWAKQKTEKTKNNKVQLRFILKVFHSLIYKKCRYDSEANFCIVMRNSNTKKAVFFK